MFTDTSEVLAKEGRVRQLEGALVWSPEVKSPGGDEQGQHRRLEIVHALRRSRRCRPDPDALRETAKLPTEAAKGGGSFLAGLAVQPFQRDADDHAGQEGQRKSEPGLLAQCEQAGEGGRGGRVTKGRCCRAVGIEEDMLFQPLPEGGREQRDEQKTPNPEQQAPKQSGHGTSRFHALTNHPSGIRG